MNLFEERNKDTILLRILINSAQNQDRHYNFKMIKNKKKKKIIKHDE